MDDYPSVSVRPYERLLHAARLHAEPSTSTPRVVERPLNPDPARPTPRLKPKTPAKTRAKRGAKK